MTYEDLCKYLLEMGFKPDEQYEVDTWNFSRYSYWYDDGEILIITFPKTDQFQCVGRVSLANSEGRQIQNRYIYIDEGSKDEGLGTRFTKQEYDDCMTHSLDECYDAIYEFLTNN